MWVMGAISPKMQLKVNLKLIWGFSSLSQSYQVDIWHIYNLFSIKFPLNVSLLSCGESIVPKRDFGTKKTVTLKHRRLNLTHLDGSFILASDLNTFLHTCSGTEFAQKYTHGQSKRFTALWNVKYYHILHLFIMLSHKNYRLFLRVEFWMI